jgi:hypothetical protein
MTWTLVTVVLFAALVPALADDFPPPLPPADDSSFGAGIQRTMTLLATSTPERRNRVKVLFYGQSITQQEWWRAVADDLRARFPSADLIIENRAIGGFSAQVLVKTAEADLYPFYPDLLIFHVYGDHREYENIIRAVRTRTTAEVLMQTDHLTKPEDITEETDPAKLTPNQWSAWFNHAFLPPTAARYGAELLDQRREWRRYLQHYNLQPAQLLRDTVHLNAQGCYLMAELVKQHLRYRPELPDTVWKNLVKTYTVGQDVKWQDGRLALDFDGNRVDLIAAAGSRPGTAAQVIIDGKKPSQFPELYTPTRCSGYPGIGWPCVMRVQSEAPLLVEDWQVRIFDGNDDLSFFRFEVVGSQTGPDGQGQCDRRFVSNSGRVVIEPSDWSVARSRKQTGNPLPEGFLAKWRVVPLYLDEYTAPAVGDPTHEATTTLAQGLSNGPHRLELVAGADGVPPLSGIRVYRPPVR